MLQYCAAEKYQEHSGEALMADPTVLACSWQQLHGRRPTAAAGQRTASDDAEEKESTPPDEELAAEAAAGHDHLSGQEEAEDAPEPEVVVQGAEPGELQPCEVWRVWAGL